MARVRVMGEREVCRPQGAAASGRLGCSLVERQSGAARVGFLHCATSGTAAAAAAATRDSARWLCWLASFRSSEPFLLPSYRPVAPPETILCSVPHPLFSVGKEGRTSGPHFLCRYGSWGYPRLKLPSSSSSLPFSLSLSLARVSLNTFRCGSFLKTRVASFEERTEGTYRHMIHLKQLLRPYGVS